MSEQIEALIEMARAQGRNADAVSELATAVRESTRAFATYAKQNESEHTQLQSEIQHLRESTETTQTALASALFEVSDTLKRQNEPKLARFANWIAEHQGVSAAMAVFLGFIMVWAYLVVKDANPSNLASWRERDNGSEKRP